MIDQKMESYFVDWAKREEVAESMVPLIGKLYRDYGVVTTIYGRSLVHNSTIDILKAHRFARQVIKDELSVFSSFVVLQALSRLDLAPTRIDASCSTYPVSNSPTFPSDGPVRSWGDLAGLIQ